MTPALTPEDLRLLVEEVLDRYGMTVEQFVETDIDDLDHDELRDLWLMVKGALTPQPRGASRPGRGSCG